MTVPNEDKGSEITGAHGRKPAIQVVCLGSGGGPCEDNVTGFLLRSVATEWARNSLLAVDAGSHLAPITRILERNFPLVYDGKSKAGEQQKQLTNGDDSHQAPESDAVNGEAPRPEPTILRSGPFAGLKFPDKSARANAMHLLRSYISAYLITHPHLDHLAGFAINTAAFHATSRPKTVAALPSTVDAMKRHIFNDVIWPNLTDEDGGVGFVTFQRLKEGGDAMVGEGEGRGYIDVCDGLGVRAFKVSHGVCTKSPPAHQHRGSGAGITDGSPTYNLSGQASAHESAASSTRRSMSISHQFSAPGTPGANRTSFHAAHQSPHLAPADSSCVVDSTAFFIRDDQTSREVLFFGDVEPDTLSLSPRNQIVWTEAARKIAHGLLGAILIECSYDDSQADAFLFGHMNPRHLITELQNLAALAEEAKMHKQMEEKGAKKRKRSAPANGLLLPEHDRKRSRSMVTRSTTWQDPQQSHRPIDILVPDVSTRFPTSVSSTTSSVPDIVPAPPAAAPLQTDQPDGPLDVTRGGGPLSPKSTSMPRVNLGEEMPLTGVQVIIMHVKDTLKDGPHVSENILVQLNDYEARLKEQGQGLGCEFVISRSGESYWV
jgi:cAMP phosphodiesterase